MLSFLHPMLLWGMLAASLPIIIHLINRRRARKVEFGAVYFVQLTKQKLARSLKLKQFLLLAARTLLLLLLPLALARPYWSPEAESVISTTSGQPASRVLILDRSFSMRAQAGGKTLFAKAVQKARDVVTSLKDSDNLALLLAPLEDDAPAPELTFQHREILEKLDGVEASYLKTDFSSALDRARLLLEGSTLAEKHLYILGDFTKVGYDMPFVLTIGGQPASVHPIDVRDAQPLANSAVMGIQTERSFFTGPQDWKISVEIGHFGAQGVENLPVSLQADGENLAGGFVSLAPGARTIKTFVQRLSRPGSVRIEALIGDDILKEDNRAYSVLDVSRSLNALVVNGKPSTIRYLDEIFYLKEALNPGGINRSQINAAVITPELFGTTPLEKVDILYWIQVPRVTSEAARKLQDYVRSGGNLFISVGPLIDLENYNEELSDLLPGRLRDVRQAGSGTGPGGKAEALHLARFDTSLASFRVFDDETARSLYEAPVRAYLSLDPDATRQKNILARYSDNAPALIEQRVGNGRVLLFTSSFSRVWNDLPIQPGFLPLVQELSRYLAGRAGDDRQRVLAVGSRYVFPEKGEAQMTDPKGKKLALSLDAEGRAVSPPLREPGFYTVQAGGLNDLIAVHLDAAESDLSPLPPEERKASLGESGFAASVSNGNLPDRRVEFTTVLAWALLLLFAVEAVILRWMG